MTLYIGVDLHPHQQTAAWCDSETGETGTAVLAHDIQKVRGFYASLPQRAVVGIEASGAIRWFEEMIWDTGHKLLVGNPVLIRKRAVSRHKNDRRDAELILTLLLRGEFPAIWRRPLESDQVLEVVRLRHRLVRQRTQVYNRLQALAHDVGLPKGRMKSTALQQAIKAVSMNESSALCRSSLFSMLSHLNDEIAELEKVLKAKAESDSRVSLLRTQKGVGYLTALTFVHTVGDIHRFKSGPKGVTSFAGLDPLEQSSAGRKRFGSISKAGSSLLRYQLGQAAQMAARSDPKLKAFTKRLAKKKPKAVVKTAAARRLLVKLSIMLRDSISAQEFDLRGSTVGNARVAQGLQ